MNAAEYEWNDRLVFLSRRAYETGTIGLVLRTDAVCDARDTGWQLLYGCETGLELVNPGTVFWCPWHGRWSWSQSWHRFYKKERRRRLPHMPMMRQPAALCRRKCRRTFLPSDDIAGIGVGKDHVIDQARHHADGKKEQNCAQPKPQKRSGFMNVIHTAKLFLFFCACFIPPLEIRRLLPEQMHCLYYTGFPRILQVIFYESFRQTAAGHPYFPERQQGQPHAVQKGVIPCVVS